MKTMLLLTLFAFLTVPHGIGNAEVAPPRPQAMAAVTQNLSGQKECLASEDVAHDLELREQKLKEKEVALLEREKELDAEKKAVNDDMSKLEAIRSEIQGLSAKDLADREEKVNKLIETFESMSPKAAAQVLGGVDDELAVMALSKLTSVKAGKILSNLNPEKSSRLSELMAYGHKVIARKEKNPNAESTRNPASEDTNRKGGNQPASSSK